MDGWMSKCTNYLCNCKLGGGQMTKSSTTTENIKIDNKKICNKPNTFIHVYEPLKLVD